MSLPRFLADEDPRRAIIVAVRRLDPSIELATVREVGLSGEPDDMILGFAKERNWLVVSHDVNAMRSTAAGRIAVGSGMRGLFLVPQKRLTLPVAEDLALIGSASRAEEWADKLADLPL